MGYRVCVRAGLEAGHQYPCRVKAAILTAGCRLNQAESDALSAWLLSRGVAVVSDIADADVCYVNTCTVTAEAERSSMQLVRRAARLSTKPSVVALGCMAERLPDLLRSTPGVTEVWSRGQKREVVNGRVPDGSRSRALLKVQDGCDRRCAYCVVSRVRGAPESVSPAAATAAVSQLVEQGYHEIVLTGLNLGSYRHGETSLARLLRRLVALPGRFRLRVGSLEPDTVTDELLELLGDPRVCPHFHLALQTADDRLLTVMNRRHSFAEFRELTGRLVAVRSEACLGADVISGLPGETRESFELTRERLTGLPLAYLHAFTFSTRDATPAVEMPGQVSVVEARRRTRELRALSASFGRRFAVRHLGTVRPAVVESDRLVMTDNYLRVRLDQPTAMPVRQYCDVQLIGFEAEEPVGAGATVPTRMDGRVMGRLLAGQEE